jgi:hypothetical protein
MNIQKCLLLSVVFGAVSALSAQSTTTLLDDTFTSGTGTGATGYLGKSGANNAGTPGVQDPDSGPTTSTAFWYGNNSTYSSTGTPPQGTDPESYNTGSGIALTNAATTQSVTANFENSGSYASLASGDLTMSFDFKFTGATVPTFQATGIRFLLFNSGSTGSLDNQLTKNTANSGGTNANSANWTGYLAGFDAGAQAGTTGIATLYNRANGGAPSANYIATAPGLNLGTASGPTAGMNLTDTYQAELTLHEVNSGEVNLAFSMEDLTTSTDLSPYDFNVNDTGATGAVATSFDGLTIGELSGENTPMLITNVSVFQAIPEPSTYAAVLGLASLGLAGIRSRRQRRMLAA